MTLTGNPKLLQNTCEEVKKFYRVCERHFAAEDMYPKINPGRYPKHRTMPIQCCFYLLQVSCYILKLMLIQVT
nr:unnamed protein product [Callosobruchus analis]